MHCAYAACHVLDLPDAGDRALPLIASLSRCTLWMVCNTTCYAKGIKGRTDIGSLLALLVRSTMFRRSSRGIIAAFFLTSHGPFLTRQFHGRVHLASSACHLIRPSAPCHCQKPFLLLKGILSSIGLFDLGAIGTFGQVHLPFAVL